MFQLRTIIYSYHLDLLFYIIQFVYSRLHANYTCMQVQLQKHRFYVFFFKTYKKNTCFVNLKILYLKRIITNQLFKKCHLSFYFFLRKPYIWLYLEYEKIQVQCINREPLNHKDVSHFGSFNLKVYNDPDIIIILQEFYHN